MGTLSILTPLPVAMCPYLIGRYIYALLPRWSICKRTQRSGVDCWVSSDHRHLWAVGHVVSGQVVRVPLQPEAALHHPSRSRDGGATAFPGVEPTGILSLQRRGRRETSAVPRTEADTFLHLVINWPFLSVVQLLMASLLCPPPNPAFSFAVCNVMYQGKIGRWLCSCCRYTIPAFQMGVVPADSE